MKRRNINEVLGVPSGILESAEKLYYNILDAIKTFPSPLEEENETNFNVDFKILDLQIDTVIFKLEFSETEDLDFVQSYAMGYLNKSEFDNKDFKIKGIFENNEISIIIKLAGPEGTTTEDVLHLFKENKDITISSLAHELKHFINFSKQKYQNIKDVGSYAGISSISLPFKPVRNFFHYLYFTHSIENIVRPTEFASLMRSENIDREQFYHFLMNNATYKMLKEINSFSYDEFRDSLLSQSNEIKTFLKRIGDNVSRLKTDDQIVDRLLHIIVINISNNTIGRIREMITTSALEDILGFREDKDKLFRDMIRHFAKFEKKPINFFKSEEKRMKEVSKKMIKKLIKLYDLAKVNPHSIQNWELHHKINRTGDNIVTELKYKTKR